MGVFGRGLSVRRVSAMSCFLLLFTLDILAHLYVSSRRTLLDSLEVTRQVANLGAKLEALIVKASQLSPINRVIASFNRRLRN